MPVAFSAEGSGQERDVCNDVHHLSNVPVMPGPRLVPEVPHLLFILAKILRRPSASSHSTDEDV